MRIEAEKVSARGVRGAVQLYNGDTDAATGPRTDPDPDPHALTLPIYFSTGICQVLGVSMRVLLVNIPRNSPG